jgi:hypothetical protein
MTIDSVRLAGRAAFMQSYLLSPVLCSQSWNGVVSPTLPGKAVVSAVVPLLDGSTNH